MAFNIGCVAIVLDHQRGAAPDVDVGDHLHGKASDMA
jgi:hypothetical protein